jgi:hypothetical protein
MPDAALQDLHDSVEAGRLAAEKCVRIAAANLKNALRTAGENHKVAREVTFGTLEPALRRFDAAAKVVQAEIAGIDARTAEAPAKPDVLPSQAEFARTERLRRALGDAARAMALMIDFVEGLTNGAMIRAGEAVEAETSRVMRGAAMTRRIEQEAAEWEKD